MDDLVLVVADPDLMWRAQLANAVAPRPSEDVPSLEGVLPLVSGRGHAGLIVGPGLAREALDQIGVLRASCNGLVVVLVAAEVSVDFLQAAMRAGIYDVIDAQASNDQIAAALEDAFAALERGPAAAEEAAGSVAPARLIVVTGAKSGEGATSVATNLAAVLADGGNRSVVLVEGDPRFGDVSLALGLAPTPLGNGFDDLATGRQEILAHVRTHEPSGVMTLVPPRSVLPMAASAQRHVIEVISGAQAIAQEVVVDAPFHLVELAELLAYADDVLLVSDLDQTSIKNSMVAVQVLGRAASSHVVELVLNRARPGEAPDLDDVERLVGVGIAGVLPDVPEAADSVATGLPLVLREPHGAYAAAMRDLAARLPS